MKKSFDKRAWLSPPNSSRSNSYVAIHCDQHEAELELADCNHRVGIHTYDMESKCRKSFIRKLRIIRDHIDMLIEHVEGLDE